ncbi:MAG: hypothetical protein ACYC7A_21400 [Thermoanaerobaculia bacterium]
MRSLYEEMYDDNGPQPFKRRRLQSAENLFRDRGALIFTPTDQLPSEWVGDGELFIRLPIVTPTYDESFEIKSYMSPRLWLDLIQRQTWKLRWRPLNSANVAFHRFDVERVREDIAISGVKALLDALKVRTSGRRDRRWIHYFGAIQDDAPGFISELSMEQSIVKHPAEAHITLRVFSASPQCATAPIAG